MDMIFYTQVVDDVFMNLFLVHKVILCIKKKIHKTLIINHLGIKILIVPLTMSPLPLNLIFSILKLK